MNIFSGAKGLGGALTNPTQLSHSKGSINQRYPVVFRGRQWPDAESAYQHFKTGGQADDDRLMVSIIAEKLRQHPLLMTEIQRRGGASFLAACSHFTGAKTASFASWEGRGLESRFIRNLIAGFELAISDAPTDPDNPQPTLF